MRVRVFAFGAGSWPTCRHVIRAHARRNATARVVQREELAYGLAFREALAQHGLNDLLELWAEDEDGVSFINTLDQDVQDEYMNALGLDTLPGSAPGYTAFMQQMHATARQPKPDTLAKPLSNGSGYRAPSADNSNATNAQQATYR